MELRKVQKSGNSLYITLPRNYLSQLDLKLGDYVRVSLRVGHLDLVPVLESRPKRRRAK